MKFTVLVLICLLVKHSVAVIYHLTEDEYSRMPALFHLDPYEDCIAPDGGKYCSITLQLVSDGPNELYNVIQEYSERSITHFNHTILQRGVCVTQRCAEYVKEKPKDLRWALEACFNESMYRDYGLKTRVIEEITCHKKHEEVNLDTGDTVVAVILGLLLLVNILGTLYEVIWHDRQDILSCFSIRSNFRRLIAGPGRPEPRLTRLKGINGLKAITIFMVIGLHSMLPFMVNVENPRFLEESYSKPGYCFVANGTPAVQTFFVISGFLLAYNIKLHEEKYPLRWTLILKRLLNRWLRLTPAYAVVLAVTATWLRHAGSGPLWDSVVVSECAHCRQYWWQQLLYINNYIDYSKCMPQMWYVACDIQLHVIGLLILVLLSGAARHAALAALLVGSMLANAAHTYARDLAAVVIPSPETSRNYFFTDQTFIHTYKRTHTNISAYAIGLALGLAIYHWEQNKYDISRILKNRFVYWLTAPGLIAVVSVGGVFYMDTERAPTYLRAIYSMFAKPAFSFIVAVVILGMVFKVETVYRGVLEWRGWTSLGRLSYCAYAVHILVIRANTGSQTVLVHGSLFSVLTELVTSNILSFALAVPLYVLVEAPFGQLLKPSSPHKPLKKQPSEEKTKQHDQRQHSEKRSL